ncbi:hypothetical protein [Nonomuraea fuscirosea]|uniref:hypothetical protein n=1 Tax=Nonomuraea fuscirosea TaxID=1291556 RepID=UPI0033FDDD3F
MDPRIVANPETSTATRAGRVPAVPDSRNLARLGGERADFSTVTGSASQVERLVTQWPNISRAIGLHGSAPLRLVPLSLIGADHDGEVIRVAVIEHHPDDGPEPAPPQRHRPARGGLFARTRPRPRAPAARRRWPSLSPARYPRPPRSDPYCPLTIDVQ